jgi:NDP-sugar pyrophosphorylase family protein
MGNINIVIPMAGLGSRFKLSGYTVPKPLIPIDDKPMIQHAVDTLGIKGNYIFICQKEHNLKPHLEAIYPGCKVIEIDYITKGSACTVLLAKTYINNDLPLIITNCDQIMWWDDKSFSTFVKNYPYDGFVVTYTESTPKNSYVKLNREGFAVEFAEKKVISSISLNGIHYWKHGKDFVYSAQNMIKTNEQYNNEFYVAPTYNTLIKDGKNIGVYHIPNEQHNAVGTPEDLIKYADKKYNYENI